jgi:lipoprotein-releasing system permease protein
VLETLLQLVQPTLGFVSATLVAIIALMFGAMFVFFSGASALVLGQFVRFARDPRVGLPAVALSVAAAIPLGLAAGEHELPWWVLPLLQGISCLVCWGALALRLPFRIVLIAIGALLLLAGASYVAAFAVEPLLYPAALALQLAAIGLVVGVLGLWPLVLAGLVGHRIARPVEWFISLRYLVAKRRQTFISIITVICVTGVALGVAVITVVLSDMNGFSAVWEDRILGTRAHFVVHARTGPFEDYQKLSERVRAVPGVVGATPFVEVEAILRGEGGELEPVLLKGIDPKTVQQATKVRDDMIQGSLDALDAEVDGAADDKDAKDRSPGIVLGVELADRYLLRMGDPVILISPMGGPSTPLGPAPRMVRFRVAGIFKSNFFQFDERFAYTSLAGAQKFMRLEKDEVTGIEVRTRDAYRSQSIGFEVEDQLGEMFFTRDWKQFYPGFFNALKTERVMMFVLLSFIMVVAGFIIIATLIMMIMEKSRDIAILKTMGCENEAVLRVFAIEGFLIGVAGLALGLGMGLVITWNLDLIQEIVERVLGVDVLPANVYQLQQLPYDIVPWHLVLISAIAMVLSIGATLLPSWQAARLDPAEALRYE